MPGFEPGSKQVIQILSTCLASFYFFEIVLDRKLSILSLSFVISSALKGVEQTIFSKDETPLQITEKQITCGILVGLPPRVT